MQDDPTPTNAYDWPLLRRLLGYLRPYPAQVVGALATIVTNSILQLAPAYLTKVVIDQHIASRDIAGVTKVAILYLIVLCASATLESAQTYIIQLTAQRIIFDLRVSVYRHLQRLDMAFHDRNPVGRLMTRVTTDVEVLNDLFTSGVHAVFFDLFTLAGIVVVLLGMNWRLALATFAVVPLVAWLSRWFRRHVRESFRAVRACVARLNAFLQENIVGMATVQLFRSEGRSFERFARINDRHRDANMQAVFYYAVFYPAIEIVAALATAVIIWYGGAQVLAGTLTLGSLVAFLLYSQRFFRPISDISEKLNALQAALAAAERIFRLLDTRPAIQAPAHPVARPASAPGRLVFDHAWFAYHGEDCVLKDVSFEVAPGERVGIVGATGSGKTTIVNLLMRFYDVTKGRILLDGVDIRHIDLKELRARFSLVLQEVQLFSGTVAGNVRLGNQAIDDAHVERAIEAVHADRFVEQLPGGLASRVAERGSTLSAGQKQLLSFARALAFDPQVLVLDEATSSVDTETELLVRDALRVLMAGRTTIAIAHRLSTIRDMDKILVLHKGELREAGSHEELLARRGIYSRLYQLQYKDQEFHQPAALGARPVRAVG